MTNIEKLAKQFSRIDFTGKTNLNKDIARYTHNNFHSLVLVLRFISIGRFDLAEQAAYIAVDVEDAGRLRGEIYPKYVELLDKYNEIISLMAK